MAIRLVQSSTKVGSNGAERKRKTAKYPAVTIERPRIHGFRPLPIAGVERRERPDAAFDAALVGSALDAEVSSVTPVDAPRIADQPVLDAILFPPADDHDGMPTDHLAITMLVYTHWIVLEESVEVFVHSEGRVERSLRHEVNHHELVDVRHLVEGACVGIDVLEIGETVNTPHFRCLRLSLCTLLYLVRMLLAGARQKIAGQIYVEIDVSASHPTMLQTRLASVGKRVPLLDEWVRDKDAVIAEINAELQRVHQMFQPSSEVKELVLAMINGASVEKWVREKWGIQGAPPKLAKFARDMQTVRANVHVWFREVWDSAQGAGSDWKRRNRAVHLLMTSLEDNVLEAMREALPRFGVQCDALTGDGLLARPTCEAATPMMDVLRALEAEVLSSTGVAVRIAGKTLDGNAATHWPTHVFSAMRAADDSWWNKLQHGGDGDV